MKILVLVAGNNVPSNSEFLADHFIEGLKEKGAETQKLLLRDLTIEHFALKHYDRTHQNEPDYLKLEKAFVEADGVVLASPIWNFSVPAHLKNVIDRIGSFALDETHSVGTLKGKPFYCIFTGGAPTAAFPALIKKTTSHIPQAIQYFGGTVFGAHYEERCTKGRGVFGLVVDQRPKTLEYMKQKGNEFAALVDYFAKTGKLPFKMALIKWIYNTGGKVKRMLGL